MNLPSKQVCINRLVVEGMGAIRGNLGIGKEKRKEEREIDFFFICHTLIFNSLLDFFSASLHSMEVKTHI